MYLSIKDPEQRISPKITGIWRITNTIGHGTVLIILFVLLAVYRAYHWPLWAAVLIYAAAGLMILSAIFSILIEPSYLQKTWRYEVDEEFIQLKHGRLNIKHTVIPMTKVEYVNTSQGPFLRRHGLYEIVIGSVSSSHTIPAVPEEEAFALRNKIAYYAKITDEDAMGEKEI